MGEAENLANAASALTAAAQTHAQAGLDVMSLMGNSIALGQDLSTTWKGKASDTFLNHLDQLAGDSLNLFSAFQDAAGIMNGLAQAIEANLAPIQKAEQLQQQAEGFQQLTATVLDQISQAQTAGNAAYATITSLANRAAASLQAITTVGVCSTGLGVFNLTTEWKTDNGKIYGIVNGKTVVVIDAATGDVISGGSGGGGGTGGGGGGGTGNGGGQDPWWHEWWGKGAPLWKRAVIRLLAGYGVSGITNGANTLIQGKPWDWKTFGVQGAFLTLSYESSVLFGIRGALDKIYSAVLTGIVLGPITSALQSGSKQPHPSPGPAPTPVPTSPSPTPSKSTPATPAPSSTPTPSASPSASAPPSYVVH